MKASPGVVLMAEVHSPAHSAAYSKAAATVLAHEKGSSAKKVETLDSDGQMLD